MEPKTIIFRNATNSSGERLDIAVSGQDIVEVGSNLSISGEDIDCSGLMVLQGFVDLHTHLREPGFEQSETVRTGSRSAAMGGFTAVHAMANTAPVADNASVVEQVHALGLEAGYVYVQPVGAVTKGLAGDELAEILKMNQSRAGVTIFSDDGKCVSNSRLMRRALEYVKTFGGVISQHAQDPDLTVNAQMNESNLSFELGLTGWPSIAEEAIIARDVLLAEYVDSRLHICHVSTLGSVEIIRSAKQRGVKVTAEVTPHHLLLTEDLVKTYDPLFKVNPPLRSNSDVAALRAAVADGTIDIIATDHAPHPVESKDCDFASGAFGMTGLETALSVSVMALVNTGHIDWQRLEYLLSTKPAEISGLTRHGKTIAKGQPANMVFIDTDGIHNHESSQSKSSNSPYRNIELPCKIVHTVYEGQFTVRDSEIQELSRA